MKWRYVFLSCGFIAVVALGQQKDQESRTARETQCKVKLHLCGQNVYQQTTCEQRLAECLSTIQADGGIDDYTMQILLCGFISVGCHCITYMADPQYKKVVYSASILAFLWWWHNYTHSLALVETCMILCRVWMGDISKDTPWLQITFFFFVVFICPFSAHLFRQQSFLFQAELYLFMVGMACWTWWSRKPDTSTETRAVREEATTGNKPPLPLLTASHRRFDER
jgi:hypothetical protein